MWHEHENAVCDYTHKHTHIDKRTVARQTNNRPTTDENVTMRCSQHCTEFVLSVNVKPATGCIHLTRNHFKCASSHNTIIQMYAYANGEDSGCQIWRICTFDIISSEATFFLIFRSIRSCTRYILFFFYLLLLCSFVSVCVRVYSLWLLIRHSTSLSTFFCFLSLVVVFVVVVVAIAISVAIVIHISIDNEMHIACTCSMPVWLRKKLPAKPYFIATTAYDACRENISIKHTCMRAWHKFATIQIWAVAFSVYR